MAEEKEQISLSINDGEPFFAHEMSVNYTPTQITLDFKCITPRNDPRSKKASFLLKHNVIMLEPWHAKSVIEVLGNVIKKYESDFGKITKPKAIDTAEKKQSKMLKETKTKKTDTPSYLG